ncbi:uncharacterized protein LOC112433089 [Maylandia zebra]|uniref:uncharacterized protein LOC112433089 n=1 Tax=Maylandia zebra TaxID=106582 RepID=UPI00403CE278
MDQCEDREEGVPPSKSTLCGEHESQTKAQRNQPGPPPSSVSCKSDASKDDFINFKVQPVSAAERGQRSQSAGSSCPSVRSDWSKHHPPDFSAEPGPTRINKRPESPGPEPSCVSLKSNESKDVGLNFKGCSSAAER